MKPSQFLFSLALAVVLSLGLAGCNGDDSSVSVPPDSGDTPPDSGGTPPDSGSDPYADKDVPPPDKITDRTIRTSGSISYSGEGDLMEINVAGFAAPVNRLAYAPSAKPRASRAARATLGGGAFTVVEDGVVKGSTVEPISADTRAAADILFVLDTTGSMASAIGSVKDSIIAFADFLDSQGLDVRLGAVTFGDAYDTQATGSTGPGTTVRGDTPPGFDSDQRPTFLFSTDFEQFKTFIGNQTARFGGDTPENSLGGLEFGYDALDYRDGAQKIAIVITDVCSHNETTFTNQYGSAANFEHWLPPQTADLVTRLQGNMTVHVVGPKDPSCLPDTTNMADFTGVEGTGGVFVDLAGGEFVLSELPIAEATTGGYVVTFRGTRDETEHMVRVVIDDGVEGPTGIRGEFTINETY